MPEYPVVSQGTRGVDMISNPLSLGASKLRAATNVSIEQGVVRTRPSVSWKNTQLTGCFQCATNYSPSKGLSAQIFAEEKAGVAITIGGKTSVLGVSQDGCISCAAGSICATSQYGGSDLVFSYQAENYLVLQSPTGNTFWWDGSSECPTESPGFAECDDEDANTRRNNSFCKERTDYLANGAWLGVYAHGRIHQQTNLTLQVSDIIHKRGWKFSDDILSMEEQASGNMPPLSTPSSLGRLTALEILPQIGASPHGEGDVIAYHQSGVVTHGTFEFPRETRVDAEGKELTQGWDKKRITSLILNTVSAVGPRSVAVTARDHFFRSAYGLHWLKSTIGSETVNDEPVNHEGHEIQPILDADDPSLLVGNSTAYWRGGNRLFSTVGHRYDANKGALPAGRGILSYNRAASYAQNGFPVQGWEGLWTFDPGIWGVHDFVNTGVFHRGKGFIALASDTAGALYAGEFIGVEGADYRDGAVLPVRAGIESGFVFAGTLSSLKDMSDGRIDFKSGQHNSFLRVSVRTDQVACWKEWRTIESCGDAAMRSDALGKPPEDVRSATWFQFKVEWDGDVEIFDFAVDLTSGDKKAGKSRCSVLECCQQDYFQYAKAES